MKKPEWSVALTVIGVILLFSGAVIVTLLAPHHIDPSWQQASSFYQVQMHTVSDPNVYVSTSNPAGSGLQYVYHLKQGETLLAFQESELVRILASPDLEPYVTRNASPLTLTSRLLMLRRPTRAGATQLQTELQDAWKVAHPDWESTGFPRFEILELYDPQEPEAFAITQTDGKVELWAENFSLEGEPPSYDISHGTIYVNNPQEYRVSEANITGLITWVYNENGEPIRDLTELKKGRLSFLSRAELITMGEALYRIEGCWYCHTDQTRTLVQDTVLNGSPSYPAPPSSANEYIFQKVTFPGTRRIGPDLSRVGIKRPHRDWHMSHFWSPQSESKGSIMPSFKHFFDDDPSGTFRSPFGVPNYQFEAIFQYLMIKGTRITSPTQAWWLGKDPIQTIDIIEGRK